MSEIRVEAWEGDEVVVTVDGAPTGQTMHRAEAERISKWLRTALHDKQIVSVEDAAIAEAVREIERETEGISIRYTPNPNKSRPGKWHPWEVGTRGAFDFENDSGEIWAAETLPLALSAYRQAAGATGEVRT